MKVIVNNVESEKIGVLMFLLIFLSADGIHVLVYVYIMFLLRNKKRKCTFYLLHHYCYVHEKCNVLEKGTEIIK